MSNASERKLPLRSGAHHWVLVSLSIVALVGGQCSATLLSRFYFERGGNSIWLLTLIPNVGWPVVFTKVLGQESLTAVLEMQIYTSVVATVVCVVGLCSSGQLRRIREEANAFTEGKLAYSMTLIWTAIGWQIHSVGLIGLISLVSSLFSTVISTVALPLVPVLAVVFFHDIMEAPKIMALILGMWGFASYVYGGYMDSKVVQVDQIQSEQISTLV
ncbi:hypothetical protein SUGI_0761500 [Cryptomeria japonica]|nr:hypothetical protein SUGI_0761500 [Cryptomeria japonica]